MSLSIPEPVHVRDVTDSLLDYDRLVKKGLIPDLFADMAKDETLAKTYRYPPFVYKTKGYASFGLFIDLIVRLALRDLVPGPFDFGSAEDLFRDERPWIKLIKEAYEEMNREVPLDFTYADFVTFIPQLQKIIQALVSEWGRYDQLTGPVRYNVALTDLEHPIEGHPDVVTAETILDIKNSASFLKMAKTSILQVLAYFSLASNQGLKIRYVGFILPMQRQIILYDLADWGFQGFYAAFLKASVRLTVSRTVNQPPPGSVLGREDYLDQFEPISSDPTEDPLILEFQGFRPLALLGSHIRKGRDLETTFSDWIRDNTVDFRNQMVIRPCQIFIASNLGTMKKETPKLLHEYARAKSLIENTGLSVFIHAPYTINLCGGTKWAQRLLNDNLRAGAAIQSRGVVVHVGARKTQPESVALLTMEEMVRTSLPFASPACKLLLETPVGEGTEVCVTIEALAQFFTRFNRSEQAKLGLCVDTCHVFAAGYHPLTYLHRWLQISPVPICLVHFNDSKGDLGSHLDRHQQVGLGKIGFREMFHIGLFCQDRGIPMVYE